jgi:hypothetical protein
MDLNLLCSAFSLTNSLAGKSRWGLADATTYSPENELFVWSSYNNIKVKPSFSVHATNQ